MRAQNTRAGIGLMVAAAAVHAVQDGISRRLGADYSVFLILWIRYWFFAAFVIVLALRRPGGFRAAVRTRRPLLQLVRAMVLIAITCIMVVSFVRLGLGGSHAVFAVGPLLVVALAGPLLGERVPLSGWLAVAAGFAGILVILQPGGAVFTPDALLPLTAALLLAAYTVLTRIATRDEPGFVTFFWSGILGLALLTVPGLSAWGTLAGRDWALMGVYGGFAILGNWLLITCYEVADAAVVQPFSYLQLVFATLIGAAVFGERLDPWTLAGAALIVAAGIFAITRAAPPVVPRLPE
jgi:drug/metabolite transporter (DMT)-like permease